MSEAVNEHAKLPWETEGGVDKKEEGWVTEVLLVHQGVSKPMRSRISFERMKVKK